MRAPIILSLLVASFLSASSFAANLAGRDLVLVIARVPGLVGSDWRTDLVLTNTSNEGPVPVVDITLTFFRSGGEPLTATLQLAQQATTTLEDVVSSTFHLPNASGLLRITGPADATIVGRAYIYNHAAIGELGQSIPAVPLDALDRTHALPALNGVGGRRTNIGLANPWATPSWAMIALNDEGGVELARTTIVLPAQSLTQFEMFGELKVAPRASATAFVTSEYGVYTYASTIRIDNGAPTFILGNGISSVNEDFGSPLCLAPAPLNRSYPNAPGWLGGIKPEFDAATAIAGLQAKYGSSIESFPSIGAFFAPQLTGAQLAALRCEPVVSVVEQNEPTTVD